MRRTAVILIAAVIAACGCASQGAQPSTSPSPSVGTAAPTDDGGAEVEVYAAVIRRLVTEDHTFGRGASPFRHVYVVNGPIPDAGDPGAVGALFEVAPEPFPPHVMAGIVEELDDLPPVTFVADADRVRRGGRGMGGVRHDGVVIALGPLEPRDERIHVSTSLWCGGLCGQWLTYVLAEDDGRWEITGTTGPQAMS
jgi:hypothetical protein